MLIMRIVILTRGIKIRRRKHNCTFLDKNYPTMSPQVSNSASVPDNKPKSHDMVVVVL